MKRILCLIGPSGSGKTFIGSILGQIDGFAEIVSHTTRNKRIGEEEGISYYFVNKDEFFATKMVEKNFYSDEWYGTSYDEVTGKLKKYDTLYQVTTYSGYEAMKKTFPDVEVISIYISASQETRERRMSIRGDSLSAIRKRIQTDINEWEKIRPKCDLIVNNDKGISPELLKTIFGGIVTD